MALAINKENYLLHKLHSLSGVVPVGYYVAQHLLLNSFSLAGPEKFDGVIGFFDSMPKFFLLGVEILLIWIPLLFHAVYGMFIVSRAKSNYFGSVYGWPQNLMYTLQRWSGVFLFFFIAIHFATTTGAKYLHNDSQYVQYAAWHDKLTTTPWMFFWVPFYIIGVATASYHLGYGLWNFCIRWGITVSQKSQDQMQKVGTACFVILTLLGWGALIGFVMPHGGAASATEDKSTKQVSRPMPHSMTRSIAVSTSWTSGNAAYS